MAVTAARLRAVVTADTAQGQAGLKAFGQQVTATRTQTQGALGGMAGAFKVLGSASAFLAPVGLAVGASQIIAFGKDAINVASDVSESYNKVSVVFDSLTGDVARFAQNSTTQLGMSRREAYAALGTFGNLFTSMGIGKQSAADMSTGLTQLAADLGSFNNIDPTLALEKLRSGMVGETEPLRALGINLTAAATQAKAMELGLLSAGGEMSTSAAVAARYALIMEQSTNAQGDFARTADGIANASRTAAKELDDLKANLGRLVEKPYQVVVNFVAEGLGNINANLSKEAFDTRDYARAFDQYRAAIENVQAAEANLTAMQELGIGALVQEAESALAAAQIQETLARTKYETAQATLGGIQPERDMAEQLRETAAAAAVAAAETSTLATERRLANLETMGVGAYDDYIGPGQYEANKAAADRKIEALRQAAAATANTGIATDYRTKMSSAIDNLSTELKSAFADAQQASIGLSDLRPGGAQGPNAPGANGAFEDIYRLQAFIQNGSWGETAGKYGLDQAGAAELIQKFQTGMWDQAVMALIDKDKLTKQIQNAQLGQAMMDAVAADLAQASGADPKLIKAMLGLSGDKAGVNAAVGTSLVPELLKSIDAQLVANATQIEARGGTFYNNIEAGFLRQAKASNAFNRMVEDMVDSSLARYTGAQ